MKLPPVTDRLVVGSLCLCACSVQVIVGEDPWLTGGVDGSGSSTGIEGGESGSSSQGGDGDVSTSGAGPTTTSATTLADDLPGSEPKPVCQMPSNLCDEDTDDLALALGVGCGSLLPTAPLTFSGPEASRAVTLGLGGGETFAPRLGTRAVMLSTGVAEQVSLAANVVMEESDCSQVGLPCPSTDFPPEYDLAVLPAPLAVQPVACPEGQVPPPGDCSGTVEAQWLGDPRLAHDYTELRFSAEVPSYTVGLEMSVAFMTAEYPKRFPGGYNDFLIVWLDSEHWTGNIAIHPDLGVPIAADALTYAYTAMDAEIADFAFAEHAATDWFRIEAPVVAGDTVTVVIALFDENDGAVDSAVLLDDLHWACSMVNL